MGSLLKFLLHVCLVVMCIILYKVKDNGLRTEAELRAVNEQINQRQRDLRIVESNWAYVSSPEWVSKLARDLLPDYRQTKTKQVVSLTDIANYSSQLTSKIKTSFNNPHSTNSNKIVNVSQAMSNR